MITQETIQQITSRIDIVEIIGEFVKLKKRGVNYLGNCPFHNEKSPSFTVSPSKEIYKCFGCGKSGNAIGFVMEHEKYGYVEALKWIAARYNIEIEETETSPEVKQQQQAAESLFILNAFAQKHFSKNLTETEEGKSVALTYLKHRGFREEVIQKFQLGYNLEAKDDLVRVLSENQFNIEYAQKAGLAVVRNEVVMDNYRGRIIFPIHNQSGKILGFGARIIKNNDKAPKYINTPENEIYVKSKILYGTYFARQAINKYDECLLVEGYTDVISLHQAGIENVVASGGTSLTIDQLRLIRKHTNNLTIIYDGDEAGVKAALRGLDMALEEGLNVKLVLIPDNEDPDSYVKKTGAALFREFVDVNKKDFIIFQLEVMLKDAGNDISKKSEIVNQIAESLSKITRAKDFVKRQEYTRQCAAILKIDEAGLITLVNQYIRDRLAKEAKPFDVNEKQLFERVSAKPEPEPLNTTIDILLDATYQEREIIKRLIEYGSEEWKDERRICDVIFEALDDYHLSSIELDKIALLYRDAQNEVGIVTREYFMYSLDITMNRFLAALLHSEYELAKWEKKMEGYTLKLDEDIFKVIESALAFFKMRKIKVMLAQLEEELLQQQNEKKEYIQTIKIYLNIKKIERETSKSMNTVLY